MTGLAVALAGAIGAPARFLLERAVTRRVGHGFPWGTAIVNVTGALLLGLLVGGVEFHNWSTDVQTVAGIGFLGAFTTFSTFAVETLRLPSRRAAAYLVVSTVGGLAAAGLGVAMMSI